MNTDRFSSFGYDKFCGDNEMTFTDEDLKRLKEYHSIDREFHANSIWVERSKLKALIARLEAAENCAKNLNNILAEHCELLEVWRKSKGER